MIVLRVFLGLSWQICYCRQLLVFIHAKSALFIRLPRFLVCSNILENILDFLDFSEILGHPLLAYQRGHSAVDCAFNLFYFFLVFDDVVSADVL